MFRRSLNERKPRQRNLCRRTNRSISYENLEERRLLAVTPMFDSGVLTVLLTEAADSANITVDEGNNDNVLVNGNLVDTDSNQDGIQAATVSDITNLTFAGTAGLTDLSVHIQGQFNTADLVSIGLNNINVATMDGDFQVNFLNGVLVGDNASLTVDGVVNVTNTVNLDSQDAADIVFTNANTDLNGPVNITTMGDVSIVDIDSVFLGTINIGGSLTVTTPNSFITDTVMSSITVGGATVLEASAVSLGNAGPATDLFVVNANITGNLLLTEQNFLIWGNDSTVGSANVQAQFITMGPNANFEILGDAVFNVGTLRLGVGGSNTFNSGRLNFNASQAFVWENSSVELFGDNSATDLDIIASGAISNIDESTLNVLEISSFQSVGLINVGNALNDEFNTGTLQFFGDTVDINEDSNMHIAGFANFANNLILTADGTITDSDDVFVFVQENAMFISRVTDPGSEGGISGVVLGDTDNDFFVAGSISFDVEDGNFVFMEDNSTVIASPDGFVNSATAINIDATGPLENSDGAIINVETNSIFDGSSIMLGQAVGDSLQFGSVTFTTGGDAALFEDNDILFTGSTFVGGDFVANAIGTINDSSQSFFNVIGNASFTGTDITLGELAAPNTEGGDGNDIFNVGTLRFNSNGDVDISENSSIVLAGTSMHFANELRLSTTGDMNGVGTISNLPGANLIVASNLFVSAIGDITLGSDATDTINFDNLNFNTSGNVDITAMFDDEESEFFIFGTSNSPNQASELRLTTNVDLRDGTSAVIQVIDFVRVEARNIVLGDTDTDCVMIPADSVFITTDDPPMVTTNESC